MPWPPLPAADCSSVARPIKFATMEASPAPPTSNPSPAKPFTAKNCTLTPELMMRSPSAEAPAFVPLNSIKGTNTVPGWLCPSMFVGCAMSGRGVRGVMTWAPPPPMLKLMVPPPPAFVS